MADYSASDLRKGLKIEVEGIPYEITEFQFVKPGKGAAMYKCRIRNMITGGTQDRTFREVEKIGKPDIMSRELVYTYESAGNYVFSDPETYEEVEISADAIGERKWYLKEEMHVDILFFNGKPIDFDLPVFVEREVVETEPGFRGDTANNVTKPAKLENGYEVQVPIFINEGDIVRIDTRTGKYADRVSSAGRK
ncbi:MAG: elongation factor P [Kiritimatiellia bacterium]|jgi:elongation factor P